MEGTGSSYLDQYIGGFLDGEITIIYGPPASGKTTICLLAAAFLSLAGKKVIYFDTEKSFSAERVKQMYKERYHEALHNILVLKADTFEKQYIFAKKLSEETFDLLIIDSLTSNYRSSEKRVEANKTMALHLQDLAALAREKHIPILCTGQVYTDFDTGALQIVGGNMIKNWSKCLFRLEKDDFRTFEIEKHPTLTKTKFSFGITDKGIDKN